MLEFKNLRSVLIQYKNIRKYIFRIHRYLESAFLEFNNVNTKVIIFVK